MSMPWHSWAAEAAKAHGLEKGVTARQDMERSGFTALNTRI
jgi:hypothetical protein